MQRVSLRERVQREGQQDQLRPIERLAPRATKRKNSLPRILSSEAERVAWNGIIEPEVNKRSEYSQLKFRKGTLVVRVRT